MSQSKPHLREARKGHFRDTRKDFLHACSMGSELWQRVREARRRTGLRQQDVAERCGIDRVAVSLWESADPKKRTQPSPDNLRHFQAITGAPWEWLQSDDSDLHDRWDPPAETAPLNAEALFDLGAAITALFMKLSESMPGAASDLAASLEQMTGRDLSEDRLASHLLRVLRGQDARESGGRMQAPPILEAIARMPLPAHRNQNQP